jgi:ABC-type transport system involved in multi-copper enzyme maturation permease subunit
MIAALKAEFRKLLTVRSTYVLFLFSLALCSVLIGFWIFGYKNVQHAHTDTSALFNSLLAAVSTVGVFLSFIAVMLVGHEYRYNTIMYNLTNTNSRTWLFLAKWKAAVVFALVFAAIVVALNWALFYVGLSLHHIHPVAQQVPMWSFLWRSAVTIVGDISFAFIITMLLRNLIAAIAVVLVLPTTIETLLQLLLKDNVKYLPYTALGNLTNVTTKISYTFSLWVVLAYIAVGGVAAYLLFRKRDAN